MKRKILIITLLLILITLLLLYINNGIYKEYSNSYFYMDTYINIKINSNKSKKEIDKIFNDIDYLYSTYHKLTDIYNEYDNVVNVYYLNNILSNGNSIEVDPRLMDIINIGKSYYDKTNGLFNIASGNLTLIWKDFINNCSEVPSNLDVNININDIKIDGNTYVKYNDVKIDLGAISKGYTTELAGKYLEDNNIYSYVINAGGNVKVGNAYNKKNYVIGITDPDNSNGIFTSININNLSVVTSGNYQRYCTIDSINYNHIINPNTKFPSNYMKSVTVISKDSTLADIYSTYLYLIPVEEGKKIVDSTPDIEAIWYIDKDNIVRSDDFNYE